MFQRDIVLSALVVILFSLFVVDSANSQKFQIRDKFTIKFGAKNYEGEFVESVFCRQAYTVQHNRNGRELTTSRPARSITKAPCDEDKSNVVQSVEAPISNGGHEKTFFNKSDGLTQSLEGKLGGVSSSNASNKKFTAVELFDLETGQSKSGFPVNGDNVKLVRMIVGDAPTAVMLTIPFGFKPPTRFFTNAVIPRRFSRRPHGRKKLGKSEFTANGLK